MKFPAAELEADSAEISATIFENPSMGVRRNLFWSISINFKPIDYAGEHWDCSMTVDWIPWAVRDWTQLDGMHLNVKYGDEGIESSFYLVEHDYGKHTVIQLQYLQDNQFSVAMKMVVDFSGYTGNDQDPALVVAVNALAIFEGIYITTENLFPKPMTVMDAAAIASEFVDLETFETPEKVQGGYIIRPRVPQK